MGIDWVRLGKATEIQFTASDTIQVQNTGIFITRQCWVLGSNMPTPGKISMDLFSKHSIRPKRNISPSACLAVLRFTL